MNHIFNLISNGTAVQATFALLGLLLIILMAITIVLFFIGFWILALKGIKEQMRKKKGDVGPKAPKIKKFKLN